MSGNELAKQLDCVSAHVAAFILKTLRCKFSSMLTTLRKLLFKVTQLHEDLDGTASTVGIRVEEPLLQRVEESIDLDLAGLCPLFLFAQISQEVSADLNDSTSQRVGFAIQELGKKTHLLDDESRFQL